MNTCKDSLEKEQVAGAILMNLSRALDCIENGLVIAKLNAHGFSKKVQLMICNYISGENKSKIKQFIHQLA